MDDEIEEYYPSGKLKSTISLKDGVRHGHQNIYYETGELMYEGEWENDQQEGVWKLYHETVPTLVLTFFSRKLSFSKSFLFLRK